MSRTPKSRSWDRLITIAEEFRLRDPATVLAGAYGRASADPTRGGTSVDGQAETHVRSAALFGWDLPESRVWIDNDISGSRFGEKKGKARPEWDRARAAVDQQQIHVLMLSETSRGARTDGFRDLVDLCRDRRIMLCIGGTLYDPGDPDQRMTLDISTDVAKADVERIHKKVIRGKTTAAHRGRPAGRPEYGLLRVYDHRGALAEVVHHPRQAPVGAEIIRRVAAGDSFGSICAWLNTHRDHQFPEGGGACTRCEIGPDEVGGACWEPTPSGKPGAKWYPQTIKQLVRSPRWIGKRAIGVFSDDDTGSRYYLPVDELELADAMWDPIVDSEVWYSANHRIQERRSGARPATRDTAKYLLGGIPVCDVCETRVYASQQTRYACVGWAAGEYRADYGHVSIDRELADRMVRAAVIVKLSDPKLRAHYEETDDEREATAKHRKELEEATHELKDLPRKVEAEEVSLMLAPAMERTLKKKIAGLEPLARPKHMHPLVDQLAGPDAEKVEKAFDGLTMAQKRELLIAITKPKQFRLKKRGKGRPHRVDRPEESFHIEFVA